MSNKMSNKKLLNKRQPSAVVIGAICTTNLIYLVFNNTLIIKKTVNQFFIEQTNQLVFLMIKILTLS